MRLGALLLALAPGLTAGVPLDRRALIRGSGRNDTLRGTSGNDVVRAGGGGDFVDTRQGGTDTVQLGEGDDRALVGDGTVRGGPGIDRIVGYGKGELNAYGDDGNDWITGSQEPTAYNNLYGGNGNDRLEGGPNEDQLFGEGDHDALYGRGGGDLLKGGNGIDLLDGGEGDDTLEGEDGDDALFGGPGNDVLRGGPGIDRLNGGRGTDIMDGGDGNDRLFGSGEGDTMTGGSGRDSFVVAVRRVTEPDTVTDFEHNVDQIRLPKPLVRRLRTEGNTLLLDRTQYFEAANLDEARSRADIVAPGLVWDLSSFIFYYFEDKVTFRPIIKVLPADPNNPRMFHTNFRISPTVEG
ncbi:Serralysin-like metalloprotease [Hyaloraphidium curvatum]|nr:Serralysin-like metalloprotease [Hyaloraphidium curvatum]